MPSNNKLRVGLLLDGLVQPAWVARIVREIESSSFAAVSLVVLNQAPAAPKKSFMSTLWRQRNELLYHCYRKLDDRIFRTEPDPFSTVDLAEALAGCPVVHVSPRRTRFSDYLSEAEVDEIKSHGPDVLLRFGFRILRGEILKAAKHGVWSYHHGDNARYRGAPPGFWEVMEGCPLTGSVLQILSEELDGGRVIYRSYASTHRYSVRRNKTSYYWKSSSFVLRCLRRLHVLGHCPAEEQSFSPYGNRLYKTPGNVQMAGLLAQLAGRYVRMRITSLLKDHQWFIGLCVGRSEDKPEPLYRFTPLKPPRGHFWADPCAIRNHKGYCVFIEDYVHKLGKGHISVLEVSADGHWTGPVKVLDRPYHLSYPFVFEWDGQYYMIPETASNKSIELYRCIEFPGKWELETVLMENVNAADTTVARIDGRWWMFTNIAVEGASKDDELHVFYADTPLGPWQAHSWNPVKSDVRSARPGGGIFEWQGEVYRPSQDCSERYGYAISINKILRITPDEYVETEVSKIKPEWAEQLLGTHCLSRVDKLTVIDGLQLRNRLIGTGR